MEEKNRKIYSVQGQVCGQNPGKGKGNLSWQGMGKTLGNGRTGAGKGGIWRTARKRGGSCTARCKAGHTRQPRKS